MWRLVFFLSTLLAVTDAFSLENPRVFVSTPVSNTPKRLVADCMTTLPVVVTADTVLDDAMSALLSHGVSIAPVVDDQKRVVGIVSSFDFLQKEAFEGALLSISGSTEEVNRYTAAAKKIVAQRVEDIMTPNPITVSPDESMRRAAMIMTERKLHGLPVTDSNGTLLGILLAADVMRDLLHVVRNLPPAALVPDDVLSA